MNKYLNKITLNIANIIKTPFTLIKLYKAFVLAKSSNAILFVSPLLRAREIKMSVALREKGWKVILIYKSTTPFTPDDYFDCAINVTLDKLAYYYAQIINPKLIHIFSGAVDSLLILFCNKKTCPLVIDINDVFCPSLFNYLQERFEPTRNCLEKADGICSRDLQIKYAEKYDKYILAKTDKILFPEYCSKNGPEMYGTPSNDISNEIHVVSVGTFCIEKNGMYDSGYLKLAELFIERKIHFHIYPHWFYLESNKSVFNLDLQDDFEEYLELQNNSKYIHIHESLHFNDLAKELIQYDFGLISGGCHELGQKLSYLTENYMNSCYSGRISDYLDARLPILINSEVKFNHWILDRYKIAFELKEVLNENFHNKLLQLKNDPELKMNVEKASEILSINNNIARLTKFYQLVIKNNPRLVKDYGLRWALAKCIPLLRNSLIEHEEAHKKLLLENNKYKRIVLAQERKLNRHAATKGTINIKSGKYYANRSLEATDASWYDELSGLLNWPEIKFKSDQLDGMDHLIEMIHIFLKSTKIVGMNSECWNILSFKNYNQLIADGYNNFKRTLGTSYFNFLVQTNDPQIQYLEATLSNTEIAKCRELANKLNDDPNFDWHDQSSYRYFILMLWVYAKHLDKNNYLAIIKEPLEGNPIGVQYENDLVTQDIANSILEYYSITNEIDFIKINTVMEIGGGYGRTAFIIIGLNPQLKYIMVDIPPALWVAQRYLSFVYKNKKIFRVCDFDSYSEVEDEILDADIIFLLPHQADLLPSRFVNLTINISSFGEMNREQINDYYVLIDRLTSNYFYTKQWYKSENPFDNVKLKSTDYPTPQSWHKIFDRQCAVQTDFFESLYKIN